MPLHTEGAVAGNALHGLHDTVGRAGRDTEQRAGIVDCLVVEAVDIVWEETSGADTIAQHSVHILPTPTARLYGDAVGRLSLRGVLAVLHTRGDVLHDVSAEGYRHGLYAAADAQHGDIAVIGETRQEKLEAVAGGIDASQSTDRLLAHPQRVMVAAAREDNPVDNVKHRGTLAGILHRAEHHRQSASLCDLIEICLAVGIVLAADIGRDAYDRTPRRVRIPGIRLADNIVNGE